MPYDQFRLDGAALLDLDHLHQRIITYHFNIPLRLTPSRATFETILRLLERDFPAESRQLVTFVPYFQISAVYTLIHRDTGAERLWQGSYNPRSRERGQVIPFQYLDPARFVDFAYTRCQNRYVLQALNNNTDQQETVWTLGELLSVILTVQTTVRVNHPVFTHHPELLQGRHGARDQHPRRQQAGRRSRRAVFSLDLE